MKLLSKSSYLSLFIIIATMILLPASQVIAKVKKPKVKTEKSHQADTVRSEFKVPAGIQDAVNFWTMVYTQYDRNFEIFHDTKNFRAIYSVLDFTSLYSDPTLDRPARLAIFQPKLDAEEQRIKQLLLNIHQKQHKPDQLTAEERKIYDMFSGDSNPNRFLEAANEKRIRAQTGIKNRFVDAIRISGSYMEEIESIFREYKLPWELTRLVFVESMFDLQAKSKVGASGVWQFMPDTGRIYGLKIDALADERNDPILATHAAARLLKHNYEALGSWPLAINAYNSGRGTMQRAVEAMNSKDISKIIQNYEGGVYGFASRNFYPSFLAALEIVNHYQKYFGELPRNPKFNYASVITSKPTYLQEIVDEKKVNLSDLVAINPHFSLPVLTNQTKIPPGYLVRIPKILDMQLTENN